MSRKIRIENYFHTHFNIHYLNVCDDSHHHQGHRLETHFTIHLITQDFENLSRVARHRLIYDGLKEEFSTGLHALSLHLMTPSEYEKHPSFLTTPNCQHQR